MWSHRYEIFSFVDFLKYKRMEGPLHGCVIRMLDLHCWGPKFAFRSLHVEFVMDESKSGAGFSQGSLVFPCLKFHSIAFSITPYLFSLITYII